MPDKGRHYQNFSAAIYTRVFDVNKMKDFNYLTENFERMSRWIKVSKMYLETHRDLVMADEATITRAKQYLEGKGVKVSGGITITVNEFNRCETYCYTNPAHRQKLQEVVEYTARLFDEIILDDYCFTTCKCAVCIQAKGDRSWTQFRLALMTEVARDLIIAPARAVNAKVKLIIKYPNWYEHFQGLGFNLETGPVLFDGIYTGNETRAPADTWQHLQLYQSYQIFRYFEAIKPGRNLGGWVDPFGCATLDRYTEQLWLTLFAKAPEITLFDFQPLQRMIRPSERAAWQGTGTSFDFDRMIAPLRQKDGTWPSEATIAMAAGYALEQADRILGKLGRPVGLKSYKPFHSTGEEFLHNYLGMVGIPMDLSPEFPAEADTILLTESAKHDPSIVDRIRCHLVKRKTVVITSGLLRALLGKGIENIVELEMPAHKALVREFFVRHSPSYKIDNPILLPQIRYLTNDSWEEVSCREGFTGYPLLHSAQYSGGMLYVLAIPDNFSDLYRLPTEVLARIQEVLLKDLYVRVESPGRVSLFVYDNDTFIVESFRDETVEVRLVVDSSTKQLRDMLSGEVFTLEELLDRKEQSTGKKACKTTVKPHSYRVFERQK